MIFNGRYMTAFFNGYESTLKLQEKTATANGEVVADAGFGGLSKVIVNVPVPEEYDGSVDITQATYTLTLSNIGNCWLSYNVDATGYTGSTVLQAGETATITDIKEFVWCGSQVSWEEEESTFTNCTVEWSSSTCIITLTGANAVANVYAYD